jgi:pilus assembly protein CpaB
MSARGQQVRNWRVLTAIVAVVLAALVGVLIYKYADDAKNDAKKPYKSVSVLVADKAIPTGTSFSSALDSGQITRAQRVQRDLPATHVSGEASDAALNKQFASLVAAHNIVAGQAIVSQDFVAQGQAQGGLSGTLQTDQAKDKANGLMAVTITVDDTHAVGGFVSPGDLINVIATEKFSDSGDSGSDGVTASAFLLPGLKVLGVGDQTTAPQVNASTSSLSKSSSSSSSSDATSSRDTRARSLITLEVTARQALQLVQAQAKADGNLYLTLNPSSFKKGDFKNTAEIVEAINLFDQKLPLVDQALAEIRAANAAKGR